MMRSAWLPSVLIVATSIASCSVYGNNLVGTAGTGAAPSSTSTSTGAAGGAGGGTSTTGNGAASTTGNGGSGGATTTTGNGGSGGTPSTTSTGGSGGTPTTTATSSGTGGTGGVLASTSSTTGTTTSSTTSSSTSSTTSTTTSSTTTSSSTSSTTSATTSSSTSSTTGTTSSSGGGCTMASQCPGTVTDCESPSCTGGVCGTAYAAPGTPTSMQTAGDCQTVVCTGSGSTTSEETDTDTPTSTNQCTVGACSGGTPTFTPQTARTPCSQNGGTLCDGAGNCVQCLTNTDCTTGVCSASDTCGGSCTDGVKDGNETDVDCGGSCPACATGQACSIPADCATDLCTTGVCAGLILSQVRTRGAGGGSDEFVELYNPASVPVTFDSTWSIQAQSAVGGSGSCAMGYAARYTGTGKVVPPHKHLLVANSAGYTGTVNPDATYTTGITDASSVVVARTIAGTLTALDALCFYDDTPSQNAFSVASCNYVCERTPISNLPHNNGSSNGSNVDLSLERLPGGSGGNTQQTYNNLADFKQTSPADPHDLASAAVP